MRPHFNTLRPEGPQRDFLELLRDGMRRAGGEHRVVFTGQVQNVEGDFRIADVFVFPSRREGMPNVVPEAFACGLASVITPIIGVPSEFGRPGREYVLADRTPDDIADAVVQLLESPERSREFGRLARAWVE